MQEEVRVLETHGEEKRRPFQRRPDGVDASIFRRIAQFRARRVLMRQRLLMAGIISALVLLVAIGAPRWWWMALIPLALSPFVILPLVSSPKIEKRFYSPACQIGFNLFITLIIALSVSLSGIQEHHPDFVWVLYVVPVATAAQVAGVGWVLVLAMASLLLGLPTIIPMGVSWLEWAVDVFSLCLVGTVVHHFSARAHFTNRALDRTRTDLVELLDFQSGDDRRPPLSLMARLCRDVMLADYGVVWMPADGGAWKAQVVDERGETTYEGDLPAETTPAKAFRSRSPACSIDESTFSWPPSLKAVRAKSSLMGGRPAKLEISVPLKGDTWATAGVLTLGYTTLPISSPQELSLVLEQLDAWISLTDTVLQNQPSARREREILSLARRISEHALGTEDIFDTIGAIFMGELGWDFVFIWLLEPEREELVLRGGYPHLDKRAKDLRLSLSADTWYTRSLREYQRYILHGWDARQDSAVWKTVKKISQGNAVQGIVPLWVREPVSGERQRVGVLVFGGPAEKGQNLDEAYFGQIVPVLQSAASALHTLSLREQLSQELYHMREISQLAGRLLASGRQLDEYGVGEELSAFAQRLFGADIVVIYGYDVEKDEFYFLSRAGYERGKQPLKLVDPKAPLLRRILEEPVGWFVRDVSKEPLLITPQGGGADKEGAQGPSFVVRQRVLSFAGLPLRVGNATYGGICLNFRRERAFSENERLRMGLFAHLAALALSSYREVETLARAQLCTFRQEQAVLLHDEFGHHLDAVAKRVDLWLLNAESRGDEEGSKQLDYVAGEIQKLQSKITKLMRDLGAAKGPARYLSQELRKLQRLFRDQYQFDIHVDVSENLPALSSAVQQALCSIASEAVQNSMRHSGTNAAWVRCWVENGTVFLEVEDAGIGFPESFPGAGEHFGLSSILWEARRLYGSVDFDTGCDGKGARVVARIPLESEHHPGVR